MKTFKEAYYMGKHRSAAWHADGGANDERHDLDNKTSDQPHSVHINGKKWKTFGSQSHATNVARKIPGATVHKEEVEINEISDKTLQSYRQKAHTQIQHYKHASGKDKPEASSVLAKREPGMKTATDKVIKKEKDRIAAQPKREPQKADSYKPLGGRDEKSGRSYSEETDMCNVCGQTPCNCTHIDEENGLQPETKMKHRVLVTYSDPHHTASHMRKEKVQKHLLVPSTNKNGESIYKAEAAEYAKKYMKKQGYKVHEVEHVGLVTKKVNEESDLSEQAPVAPTVDRKYIKGTPEWKAQKEKSKPRTGHPTNVKEEAEQIDELNKDTLKSYVNKVAADSQKHKKDPTKRSPEKADKSVTGFAKAFNRLNKEEAEQIDELSNDKLDQYKKAAGEDASKQDKAGNFEKGHKRFKGIMKATFKQFANDAKK